MFNNFPKISTQQQQEIESRNRFKSLINKDLLLIRDEIESDFGVDIILEAIIDKAIMTNFRTYIQLKSVKTVRFNKDKSVSFSVDTKNLNYLLNQINSIYIVYFEDKDMFFWDWVVNIKLYCDSKNIDLISTTNKTIAYRFNKPLIKESFDNIFQIIINSGNNFRIFHENNELLSLINKGIYNIDFKFIGLDMNKLYVENKFDDIILNLKDKEKSVHDCELVSSCFYSLYRYNEGFVYTEEKLKIYYSDNLLTLKACMLCEGGICENSNIKITMSKEIFEKLINTAPTYVNFYNLGNTVSALSDYQYAEQLYKKSLELNSDFYMAWKNLGTIYYYLKQHDKELECYDNALRIYPDLIEANISKGLTLAKIYGKYNEAIDILENVYCDEQGMSKKWVYFYYWKASIYLANNTPQKALHNINKYLTYRPDNEAGIYLKFEIYYSLVREDNSYGEEALNYLLMIRNYIKDSTEIMLEILYLNFELNSNDICKGITEELCQMNNIKIKFQAETFECFNLKEIYILFLNIDFYIKFRNLSILQEYQFNISDSENNIELDINILWFSFGILFVKSMEKFQDVKINTNSLANYFNYILNSAKDLIEIIIKLLCCKYIHNSTDEKSKVMSLLMVHIPEIILREVSRIFGWICGLNGVRNKLSDLAVQKANISDDYLIDTMISVMYKINNELRLLKDE